MSYVPFPNLGPKGPTLHIWEAFINFHPLKPPKPLTVSGSFQPSWPLIPLIHFISEKRREEPSPSTLFTDKPTKQTNNETREPVAKHSKTSFPCIRIINYVHFASTQKYLHLPLPQKKTTCKHIHVVSPPFSTNLRSRKKTHPTNRTPTNDQQEIYHGTWKRPFFEGTVTSSVGKGKSFTFMTGSL